MIQLEAPFTEEKIRALKLGDEVEITGIIFTGRDAAHKYIHEGGELPPDMDLKDKIIYHCGPVVIKDGNGEWKVVAAGPTTSIREEPYQGDIIKQLGLRAVIGKGGMGEKTLAACKKFGSPEAMWELEVVKFPVVVTMDSHGNSLHKEILEKSTAVFNRLVNKQ